ncbi:hypothetical protein WI71_14335 [Burkholderia diffusa]|nr:hypothetical protein WI71_14335 [Burkholderia diffusa]
MHALRPLADELRAFVLDSVAKTGGHLASNLGSVEVAIALHYAFETPYDRIVWDVGHQSYPHKILTGRRDAMAGIRQGGGISGFPCWSELEYDAFGTAHSSTSISAALGMAHAARLRGETRHCVAVIGDGALSAGMAVEALNNAGAASNLPLIVLPNDNDMSISPPVGAAPESRSRPSSRHCLSGCPCCGARGLPRPADASRSSHSEPWLRRVLPPPKYLTQRSSTCDL